MRRTTAEPCPHAEVRARLFDARRGALSDVEATLLADSLAACPECARHAERLGDLLDAAAGASADAFWPEGATESGRADLFAAIMVEVDAERVASAAEEEADERPSAWWSTPRLIAAAAVVLVASVAALAAFVGQGGGSEGGAPLTAPGGLAAVAGPYSALERATVVPNLTVYSSPGARYIITEGTPRRIRVESGAVLVDFLPVNGERLVAEAAGTEVSVVGTIFYARVDATAPEVAEVGVLVGAVEVRRPGAPDLRLGELRRVRGAGPSEAIPAAERQALERNVDVERHRMMLGALASRLPAPAEAGPLAEVAEIEPVAAPAEVAKAADPEVGAVVAEVAAVQPGGPGAEVVEPAARAARGAARGVAASEGRAPHTLQPRPAAAPVAPRDVAAPDRHGEAPRAAGGAGGPRPVEVVVEASPASEPVAPEPPEPVRADPRRLRDEAREALRAGDASRAASLYEEALTRLGPAAPEAASVRLELARLYASRLGQSGRAVEHLRAFVDRYPEDVAAPSARQQLCRMLGPGAGDDVRCRGRVVP